MDTDKCQGKCGFFKTSVYDICKICEKKDIKKRELNIDINELDLANNKKQKIVKDLIQKNTSRCWECRKKIGLTGVQCRCKYYFCGKHRYPEEHKCIIDYKKIDRDNLKKNIVKCQFKKLEKI